MNLGEKFIFSQEPGSRRPRCCEYRQIEQIFPDKRILPNIEHMRNEVGASSRLVVPSGGSLVSQIRYSGTDKMLNDKDTEVMRAMLSQVAIGHEDQMSA
jgi:hypothetical protein